MPVQQHPIPQNVTSYQFRLVGDLTLKQFLQIAVGVIIAIIFYSLPLPFFFKWPLVAISAGIGAAIAFLPVQGRPLDQWIIAFIKSIYTPTIYTWQKPEDADSARLDFTPQLPHPPTSTPNPPSPTTLPPQSSPSQSVPTTSLEVNPTSKPSSQGQVNLPTPTPQIHIQTPTQTPPPSPSQPTLISESRDVTRHAKTVELPKNQPTSVEKQLRPDAPQTTTSSNPAGSLPTTPSSSPQAGTKASFATDLPIPHAPSTPNTIVGMTLSPEGKILDSTIVEILKNGQTIRATKSNKLGQFLFAKPLDDGLYQITGDKDNHQFPRFDLKLENKIVPPIRLQALS